MLVQERRRSFEGGAYQNDVNTNQIRCDFSDYGDQAALGCKVGRESFWEEEMEDGVFWQVKGPRVVLKTKVKQSSSVAQFLAYYSGDLRQNGCSGDRLAG